MRATSALAHVLRHQARVAFESVQLIAERGPLSVFARRHADIDAKLLLACVLLPSTNVAAIVRGPDGQTWLRIQPELRSEPGGGLELETWALDGPRPVLVDAEQARRTTVILAD